MAFTTQLLPSLPPWRWPAFSYWLMVFFELNMHIHMLDREKATASLKALIFFGSLLKILQAIAIISYTERMLFHCKVQVLNSLNI